VTKRAFLLLILLLGGLLLTPQYGTYAQEEETTAVEETSGSAKGAGQVILMIGLGAVGAVGFTYWARQKREEDPAVS